MNSELRDQILNMDFVDTHNHLVYNRLTANNFWDIAEYFWLARHLWAAGYPKNSNELDEKTRTEEFIKAYKASKNTVWCWALDKIFSDLYSIRLTDSRSVYDAIEAVRDSNQKPGWAKKVVDMAGMKKAVGNNPEAHYDFDGLPEVSITIPRIESRMREWVRVIYESQNPLAEAEKICEEIDDLLRSYKSAGRKGIMTSLPRLQGNTYIEPMEALKKDNSFDTSYISVLHMLCSSIEKHGLFLQFFLGVEDGFSSCAAPANDPDRITKLYGLFERYHCRFDLVVATKANNLDTVLAANVFSNVSVGALWWYSYFQSSYTESMQYRLELLPSIKSSIIATDARCIEWCYGKAIVAKTVLSEFLSDKIEKGWLDRELACNVARGWLFDAPLKLLGEE